MTLQKYNFEARFLLPLFNSIGMLWCSWLPTSSSTCFNV